MCYPHRMSRSKAQKPLHVVWFKRDLRIEDHRALAEAADAAAEAGGTLRRYTWLNPVGGPNPINQRGNGSLFAKASRNCVGTSRRAAARLWSYALVTLFGFCRICTRDFI